MTPVDEPLQVVAVAAVLFRGDRCLSVRRSSWRDAGPGRWETPSGRVRDGEQPLEAVKREVDEESGLEVFFDPRPVTAYQTVRVDLPMTLIVYRARVTGGELQLSDEHDAFEWTTPTEFAKLSEFEQLVAAVRLAAELPWPDSPQPAAADERA